MEEWIQEVFQNYLIGEFTTIDKDTPKTFPMLYFYKNNEFIMTSSVIFSKKIENIKKNPKTSLLLSDNTGSGVSEKHVALLQGHASIDESDLDHGWEQYKEDWLKKEPLIQGYFDVRESLPTFWKRVIIKFKPTRVLGWKGGDTSKEPVVYDL